MDLLLKKITNVGIQNAMPKSQARAIILSNFIALIACVLSIVYFSFWIQNGFSRYDVAILCVITLLATVIVLNSAGLINISRVLLTITIPSASLYMLLNERLQHPENFAYAPSPGIYCVLLSTAIIPLLVFSAKEKKLLYVCIGINFTLYVSLDIVLRFYSQLHAFPSVSRYLANNLALLISYFLLIGSVISLKKLIDEFENSNTLLIEKLSLKNVDLEKTNIELHESYKNIETQNEEIQAQSEELIQSQDSLMLAHIEIERQKRALEDQNDLLAKSLDEKSRDLLNSNQQLVTQNNELQQFSYTVSHNLRGPVASLLGLVNIHRLASAEEQAAIVVLIEQAALSLETIIRDLNKIIDIRHDKFDAFEDVDFASELELICKSLQTFMDETRVTLRTDFQMTRIVSIKAYINSILYNLVSNAIQYRSHDRSPHIQVTTRASQDYMILEVSDNGMGIDLSKFQGDMFKLYKRFHTHTQGKGLGLYIIKQQIEKLNGRIEVMSTLDAGTTFQVWLPLKMEA